MISCSFRSQENNLFRFPLVFSNKLEFEGDENNSDYELWHTLSKRIHFEYLTSSAERALINSISDTMTKSGEFAKPIMSFNKFISGICLLEGKKSLDSPVLLPFDKIYVDDMIFLFRKPVDEISRSNYKKYYNSIVNIHTRQTEPALLAIRNRIDSRIPPLPENSICQKYHREIRNYCLHEAVHWFSLNNYLVHPSDCKSNYGKSDSLANPDVEQNTGVKLKTGIPINFNRKVLNINL